MHVDGFRFDLATILAREPHGFDKQGGFLEACRQDPVLSNGEADRRAVGLRARRLSGRRVPAGLGGVERRLPRHGARLTGAATRASCRRLAARLTASADLFNQARPQALGVGELHHRP